MLDKWWDQPCLPVCWAASECLHDLRAHIPHFTLKHFIIYLPYIHWFTWPVLNDTVTFSLQPTLGSLKSLRKIHVFAFPTTPKIWVSRCIVKPRNMHFCNFFPFPSPMILTQFLFETHWIKLNLRDRTIMYCAWSKLLANTS